MEQLTQSELLGKVKKALGISGTYQDETIQLYIDESQAYMLDAGVDATIINSTLCVGAICRGVSDLWNYGSGNAQLSQYFKERVIQLASYEGIDPPIPPTPTIVTITGFELYPDGSGNVDGAKIIMSDGTVIPATFIYPEELTLTSTANGNIGETVVTVSPNITKGNQYKIKSQVGNALVVPSIHTDVSDWDDWDGVSIINSTNNWTLVVAECDVSGKVVKAGNVKVSAKLF